LGTYFAQVAEVLCQEDIANPELLTLVLNALYGIANMNLDEVKVRATFELRCACLAGYTPDLSGCCQCGNPNVTRFDLLAGQFECATCRSIGSDGIRMPVQSSVLDAIRYICTCDARRIFSFTLGTDALDQLSKITELYLLTQLERGFSTLDFYKSLLIMP
jgi:DNA repair protein RecO (recombination protein O)